MNDLLQAGLHNAVAACLLAGVVFCVTRVWRNPELEHALWLVVLLKFVFPPLIPLPAVPVSWERESRRVAALVRDNVPALRQTGVQRGSERSPRS